MRENYEGVLSCKAALVGVMLAILPGAAFAQGPSQNGGFVNPFAFLFRTSGPQCIPAVPDPSIYTRCRLETRRGQQVCACDRAYDTDPKDRQASVSAGSISVVGATPTAPTTTTTAPTTTTTAPTPPTTTTAPTTTTTSGGTITIVSITPDEPTTPTGKQKGNNGIGNGVDPQPPGDPKVNDGPGEQPGNN